MRPLRASDATHSAANGAITGLCHNGCNRSLIQSHTGSLNRAVILWTHTTDVRIGLHAIAAIKHGE